MKGILLILLFITAIIAACQKDDADYEGYTAISGQEVFDSLKPQNVPLYYEIRNNYCFDSTSYNVVYADGQRPYIDSLYSNTNNGVYYSNGNICLYNYILTWDGATYTFLDTYEEILGFLGDIDCKGDALFVAHLNGYYFRFDDMKFGMKETEGGYQVYACKMVSGCRPVQIDKFLLKISHQGIIEILEQTVLSKDEGACI